MTSILRFVFRASLIMMIFQSAHAAVSIYVAYAENERSPVYFPDPWLGSPKTTFLGYPGPAWDTGAILILNTGSSNVVLSQVAKVDGFADGSSLPRCAWRVSAPASFSSSSRPAPHR